jgi:hypothetical protein
MSEWGNPSVVIPDTRAHAREGTGGTETSHVPRGKERIPVVAVSEPGGAQTSSAYEAVAAAELGLNETDGGDDRLLVLICTKIRTLLEGATGGGESPVGDGVEIGMVGDREYRRTREIRWEAGPPTAQG